MNLWIWVLNCTVLFLHFYCVSQNEVKILVVDFMITLSWHKSVLPEKGRVILPPPFQSASTYSPFLLLALAQESVWQLSELIPIKTKPVCIQNQVMSRQKWGTYSFGRNTDLC